MKRPLGAILLLVASACNTDALPPAATFTSVNGNVVDAVSGKPVAGATITIDAILSATSDATGKFSVSQVPSGIVDYTVTATGYQLVTSSGSAEPNQPFVLNVTLDPATGH